MKYLRAFLVWLLIIFAETIHGTLRQIFLVPATGDFRARQIATFTGMFLIFLIACFFIQWINALSAGSLILIGLMWAGLTLLFEFVLRIFIFNFPPERILEDYDIKRGGLMVFGLIFMIFAPLLAARFRLLREK